MDIKNKKKIGGILLISIFMISILPSVMFNLTASPQINLNPTQTDDLDGYTFVDSNIEINDVKSSAEIIGTPSIYSTRFLELFDDLMTEGYLSPEGVPYHSIETFMIEAPDYGHMTTSEAFSFYVWLGAQYAQMTGDWSYYKTAWDITEQYMIPQQGVDQFGGGYNPSSPATYAAEEDLPSDYPNQGDSSFPTGIDPIANELSSTYGDGIYQMHWLMDVDNWYGYGDRGDGTSRTSFINTYQRGPQESVWETVPHPSYEDFTWGNENGFLPIFADFGDYAPQWRYTSASDADARQVQASYWALKWAEEQGVANEIADYTSKASKMGDYLRYTMYDKYFKPIGIEDGSTVGTGEDSNTQLLTWYSSWGGAMDDAWGFRIGASHSHQGYQNPLAAYALSNVDELIPASPTAKTSWANSETRQIELAQYLQSADGAIAGGVTNSYNGRYEAYPAGASTFYDMIYDESPVYEDPPSNNWFGMQVWGTERLIAHYLETGDARTKAISDKWVDWAISQTHLFEDGTFEIPSTLSWSGQPDTWTGTPTGNTGLHVAVENWGTDLGITGGFAKMLIEYAAATEKWEGTADNDAYTTAKELLDRMWTLYRDDVGLAAPEGRADYSRLDDEVYIPTDYTGVNGQGATLTNGMTFLDMRPEYLNDPDYARVRAAIDADEDPEMTYHRFWAQADIALALGMMHMYFPMEDDGQPPAAPTGLVATEVGSRFVDLNWNDNTEEDFSKYNIYRSNTPNVQLIATNLVGTSSISTYSDTGLEPETNYYYVLTAVDIFDHESTGSIELSVTTGAPVPPPAAPTGLTAIASTTSSISLDWNDNSESDMDHYVVYRSASPAVTPIAGNEIASVVSSSYLDSGLTDNTNYYYIVTAINTNGEVSDPSQELMATTDEIVEPDVHLRLQYQCAETATSSSQLKPWMNLYNDDTISVALSDVTIRYWFTSEASLANMVCDIDYAQMGSGNIVTSFGSGTTSDYLELGFTTGASTLSAGANTGQIQNRIHSSSYATLNQGNDYSFDASASAFKDSVLVTVYYQGELVWGVEPLSNQEPIVNSPANVVYNEGTTGHSITWVAEDDNPTTYEITQESVIVDSGTWVDGASITISVDGLSEGVYSYEITVSDADGLSDSDEVSVTVEGTGLIAPILNSPLDISYLLGETGNSISWTATDDNPSTYSITQDGTEVDSGTWTSGVSIDIGVDGLAVGSSTYIITVTDGDSQSDSDSVKVTVIDGSAGTVWMGDVTDQNLGAAFDTTIYVDSGVQRLASYGMIISFDPAILQVSGVVASAGGFLAAVNINNAAGTINVAGFEAAGVDPNAMVDLIVISWTAETIGESAIDINVDTLTDESTTTIGTPNGVSNNIMVVPAFDLGDVNHDGSVTIVDALLVAQFYVGDPVVIDETLADVNLDGTVTIVDALLIAQFYVGEIPSLPPPQ